MKKFLESLSEEDLVKIEVLGTFTDDHILCVELKIKNKRGSKKKLRKTITLEQFLELPEALYVIWEKAAYEVNPTWAPQQEEETPEQGEAQEPAIDAS